MIKLEMWPSPGSQRPLSDTERDVIIEKFVAFLSTADGMRKLRDSLQELNNKRAQMDRDSRIDPAILKEPMTF